MTAWAESDAAAAKRRAAAAGGLPACVEDMASDRVAKPFYAPGPEIAAGLRLFEVARHVEDHVHVSVALHGANEERTRLDRDHRAVRPRPPCPVIDRRVH